MRAFARTVYGLILRLHPHDFRAEFGEEMLWIFDEQMDGGEGGVAHALMCAGLLLDALRSACIQRALREHQRESLGGLFEYMTSRDRVIHVEQGGFLVFSFAFNIFFIFLCLKMMFSNL